VTGEPAQYVVRTSPADSFFVRLVASLLLLRLLAFALRWAIQRVRH
jgi:hypothetical protein